MVYAMLYAENGDVVGTYESYAAALDDLAAFVNEHPGLQDEVGLRPYENGRPAGEFEPASDLVSDRIAQGHLV